MNKENYTDEEFLEEVEQASKIPMDQYYGWFVKELAQRYLSERKKRADNPGVWDGSPEYAGCVLITYKKDSKDKGCIWSKYYERTLPKTKAREIAEKAVNDGNGFHAMINGVRAVDVIEQAILEYEKQTKGE